MYGAIYSIIMQVALVIAFQSAAFSQQIHPCDVFNDSWLKLNAELCEKNYQSADKYTLYAIGRKYEDGFANAKYSGNVLVKMGVSDTLKAIIWYERAADIGDDGSAYVLGNIYFFGQGNVTKNYEKSIYWFKRAVSLKNPTASTELASIYGRGFKSIPQLQNDYLHYYWTLVGDAIDKKPDFKFNKSIEDKLSYKQIIDVQNKVEICVKSDFKNCNP